MSVILEKFVWKVDWPTLDKRCQSLPDGVSGRRASGKVMVDFDYFVNRIDFIEKDWDFRIVGDYPVNDCGSVQVRLIQALSDGDPVPESGDSTHDGTIAHGDENRALLPEFPEQMKVIGIRDSSLDEPDIAFAEFFNVIDRGPVEIDSIDQVEDSVIDVEERHVASETSGE